MGGGGGGGGGRGGGRRNEYVADGARFIMQQFKNEVAAELGIPNYDTVDKGSLPARLHGKVGGNMVKKMIQMAESQLRNGGIPLSLEVAAATKLNDFADGRTGRGKGLATIAASEAGFLAQGQVPPVLAGTQEAVQKASRNAAQQQAAIQINPALADGAMQTPMQQMAQQPTMAAAAATGVPAVDGTTTAAMGTMPTQSAPTIPLMAAIQQQQRGLATAAQASLLGGGGGGSGGSAGGAAGGMIPPTATAAIANAPMLRQIGALQ